MKLRKIYGVVAVLLCMLMIATPLNTLADSNRKAGDYVQTEISTTKEFVTVSLDLIRNSDITSGKVIIFYNPEQLDVDWVTNTSSIGLQDVNTAYNSDGKTGVSIAFTSDKAIKGAKNILTVEFKAKNAKDGDKVTLETAVDEIYTTSGVVERSTENLITTETLSIAEKNILGDRNSTGNKIVNKVVSGFGKIISIFRGIFKP